MKFFSLFSPSLKPAWSFSTAHTLWRIIFSHNNFIVGEDRNTDEKLVSFVCLNATDGKVLWRDKTFSEKWWIGIEGVTNEHLYLHEFKKPDIPEHQGIIAVDLLTGTELWRNMHCTFLTATELFVYGFKDLFERRLYYKMNRQAGEIVEELQSLPEDIEPNLQMEKVDFQFPRTAEDTAGDIRDQLRGAAPDEDGNIKSMEFAETGKFLVVNVHMMLPGNKSGAMKNSLYIIDSSVKKKVYSDVLNESTPYPVPDSFFLDGQTVYYIKERKTLVSLSLANA